MNVCFAAQALSARSLAAGEILLRAGDPQGIELVGEARIAPPKATPEELEAAGLAGRPVVQVGLSSKENNKEAKAIFSPAVPADGYYDVYVRWFSPSYVYSVTESLPITIDGAGDPVTYRVNQKLGHSWIFLGTHHFATGAECKIFVDADRTLGSSNIAEVKLVSSEKPPEKQPPHTVAVPADAQDDFGRLRGRLAELLTPPLDSDYKDTLVAAKVGQANVDAYLYWKTMQKGEGVTELWKDPQVGRDLSKNEGGGWPLVAQYNRLLDMARAYVSSAWPLGFGQKMQGNPELLADILYGLEFLHKNRFNEQTKNKLGADWIANEMTQPKAILEMLILLHPHIPDELVRKQVAAIEKMNPDPLRFYGGGGVTAGSNRFGFVYNHILLAVMEKDPERLQRTVDLMWDQFEFNNRVWPLQVLNKPKLDGFYEDGSFIYHENLPYMTIYGTNVFIRFAAIRDLLAGSRWHLDDPRMGALAEWIYRGVEPLVFRGDSFYRPTGRSVGQSWIQNNGAAYILIDSVAQLVQSAAPEDRAAFEGMVKRWMTEDALGGALNFTGKSSMQLPTVLEIRRIVNDPKIKATPAPLGPFVFYNTDYVVYHQPGYAASLAMSSTRIATHEMMQGVNNQGWYQADGTLFVHTPDPLRYNGDFWPTINPYRLPGITVDTQERKRGDTGAGNQGKKSTSPWAGGVQLGDYAMASMGLAAQESSLTAQKAWFFFGEQIVCLGSAITSSDNRTIETIVENAKLNAAGDNAFVVDGRTEPATPGWSADLPAAKWAFLAGSFPDSDMGWVFPGGSNLKALRETRTGKWQDLFVRDKEKGDKTNTFLTLWYDHGKNPQGAMYAYIILPGKTQEAVKAYAANPGAEIVANSAEVQSVNAPALGVRGANFWSAGSATGITSSGKAAVLVLEKDGKLSIAVSDPTQLETSVEVTLDARVTSQLQADERIKVVSMNPVKLSVHLDGSSGKSLLVEFQK